jgi:hypothetical protein
VRARLAKVRAQLAAWGLDGHALAWTVSFGVMVFFSYYLVTFLVDEWNDDTRFTHRDFHNFYNAGLRIRRGESPYEHDEIPFLLPPPSAPFVIALSLLPEHVAYVAVDFAIAMLFVLGTWLVAEACRGSFRSRLTVLAIAASAPPFWFTLYLGQLAGLYLALLAGGLVLLADERVKENEVVVGLVAALLVLKPQLSFGLLLVMLLRRAWRAWAVLVLASVVLAVIAVPILGVDAFPTWLEQMSWCGAALETASTTWWRQFTLYAFLRGTTSTWGMSMEDTRVLYAVLVLPLGVLALGTLWSAARHPSHALRMRAAAVVFLATVSLNIYLFYYDSALLVVPAMIAFLERDSYAKVTRGVLLVLVVLSYGLSFETPLYSRTVIPLPGLVGAIWLVVECVDLMLATGRVPTPNVQGGAPLGLATEMAP